jgi:hypothetical protein
LDITACGHGLLLDTTNQSVSILPFCSRPVKGATAVSGVTGVENEKLMQLSL